MIIHQNIDLKNVATAGRGYNWLKLNCQKCLIPFWGHGYVLRIFTAEGDPIPIKRWRCQKCGVVVTIRPLSHWRRYQESKVKIYDALLHRLQYLIWPPWTTRQRGGHWLRQFLHKCKIFLLSNGKDIVADVLFFKEKDLAIF